MNNDIVLKKLVNTAGFINRLAHEYMELDKNIILNTIKNIIKYYSKYILEIRKLL